MHGPRCGIALDELPCELGRTGVAVVTSTRHRFFIRRRILRMNKDAQAIEQGSFDVLTAREALYDGRLNLVPSGWCS
jgi:hypothetical protein